MALRDAQAKAAELPLVCFLGGERLGEKAGGRGFGPTGLSVSSHTFPEFSAHLLGVTRTAGWLEYLDHAGPILLDPVRVENGFAYPSERAGSGIAWDESALNGYLLRDP